MDDTFEIRGAARSDNAAVVRLWSCPSFKRMLPEAVQDGLPMDPAYLASAASSMTKTGNLFLVVQGGEIVGTLNRFGSPASPKIGWFVGEPFRGRGIATNAVESFVTRLLADGATEVRFATFPDNVASLRIADKLGLSPSFDERGNPAFLIRADEWEARLLAVEPRI